MKDKKKITDHRSNKDIMKKVLDHIGKYKFFLLFSIVLAAVSVVLTLYIPILTGQAVDCILGPGAVDFDGIWAILKEMAVIIVITAAVQWLMNTCNNKIAYQVVRDVRDEAFKKLQILPLKYIDGHSHGDIVSRIIADVDQFSDGLLLGFTQLFTGIVTIIGTLVFMFSINVSTTVVVVILTPLSFFIAGFIAKRTFNMSKLQSETRGEQTALIDEMIGNEKVVKAFNHEPQVMEQFEEINGRLEKASVKAIFFSSLTNPCTRFVNSLVYAGVGILGAFLAIRGRISVGQLTSFLSYANQYTKPFNEISGVVTELQTALACAGRVFEFIEEEPQVPDAQGAAVLTQPEGNVTMQNVNFSYNPEQKLIQDFNLEVKSGQRVAIVGPTGCGKTTVINLLMRFYDVNSGSIRIDGVDVRDMTRRSLRGSFGMVLQETWLHAGTIRDNIVMGKPDATDEEVVAAAKAAHAHSFIKRLPDGYDTDIGQRGVKLSGGQKQRLSIARVFLKNPPILIFDEATSALDNESEKVVQESLEKLAKNRTTFVIAHRLSTIRNAQKILVLTDSGIEEEGSHRELLEKDGIYAKLYSMQFAG